MLGVFLFCVTCHVALGMCCGGTLAAELREVRGYVLLYLAIFAVCLWHSDGAAGDAVCQLFPKEFTAAYFREEGAFFLREISGLLTMFLDLFLEMGRFFLIRISEFPGVVGGVVMTILEWWRLL